MVVDGKVANRFIKHALASAISPANFESSSSSQKPTHIRFDDEQSSSTQPPAPTESNVEPNEEESSSDSDAEPEVGTWKAKKRAREADLAKQRAGEDEEVESDESLDGWEEANSGSAAAADLEQAEVQEGPASRAKRPRMDPFAGYSQPRSKRSEPAETTAKSTPSSSTPVPQPSRDPDQQVDDTASRLSPASASAPSTSSAPVGKKVRRKNKGGARHRKTSKNAPSQK
ncbi:hypothetical protein FRC12_008756 [Ceratobasidium sp. 428]|nr:hypothetical protein FRC12_008756 [Ceratobasidium sp. 428]